MHYCRFLRHKDTHTHTHTHTTHTQHTTRNTQIPASPHQTSIFRSSFLVYSSLFFYLDFLSKSRPMSPPGSAGTLEGTQQVPSDQDVDNENTSICATVGCYNEAEPTVSDWLRSLLPSRKGVLRYARSVFVFTQWLPRYSYGWIVGDCIAGLTVGFVVIPQAMAYALLATLSPEYGLYTSFMGAALYWIFGTSKDIVIGVRCRMPLDCFRPSS